MKDCVRGRYGQIKGLGKGSLDVTVYCIMTAKKRHPIDTEAMATAR